MLGSPAGHAGGATQRGLWPLAPAPAPPAAHLSNEGYSRYGVYSLFPGAGSPAPGVGVGAALYSHTSTIGRFGPGQAATPGHTSATTFHAAHKVTDSLFSSSNYTFGAPTPPPGSPYSPIPVAQLELLAKGISSSVASVVHSSNNTVFSIKKPLSLNTTDDKRCEERCWAAVKSEKRLSSSSCGCLGSPTKTKFSDPNSGCSRTNPVDWSSVCVKREPGAVPCQVAEITTSDVGASVVKVEATSPAINKSEMQVTVPQSIANGNIPIGIAVARQRLQHDLTPNSPTLGHQGLLAPITPSQSLKELNRIAEIASPGMAATATGGVTGGGTMLQCNDDRASGLAAWPMGGVHGSALTTPTLWQYPAPMVEPMLPMPLPMPPVGFQLVRDPVSGHFLLIPTATLEQLQQAVVWPSYPQPSSHVLLPPLPPPPLAPLQLLSSSSADYLATSTTLHQHTQSTRLVALTTDTKRKLPMPLPAHTLIKIEADCTSATSTLDHTKHQVQHSVSTVMSSNTGAIYTDPSVTPMLTTHVFYQHPTTNLILSHQADPSCKSQATSPACLTPPPEGSPLHEQDMPLSLCVQDASNQTETHIFSEEEQMIETGSNDHYCKTPVRSDTPDKIDVIDSTVEIKHDQTTTEVPESTTVNNNNEYEYNEHKTEDYVIQATAISDETKEKTCKPDISGLELLSNSIVEFENSRQSAETTPIKYEVSHDLKTEEQITETNDDVLNGIAHMTLKDRENEASATAVDDTLGGLGLLCALAEQRFMEEVVDKQQAEAKPKHKKERRCDSEERRNKKKLKRCHDLNDSKSKRFKHGTGSGEFDCDRRAEDDLINDREREKIRENELELERERLSVLKRVTGERGLTAAEKGKRDLSSDLGITAECDKRKTDKYRKDNDLGGSKNNNCSCKDERNNHRTYKTRECEDEQNFTNNNNCNNNNNNNNNKQEQQSNSEWVPGFMSAVERDMRQQLADLQRQYKEKQLELSKLAPKKTETDLQDELNKASERSPSPPLLDKIDTTPVIRYASPNLLKPPTLCPITPPAEEPKCNEDVALKQDDKSCKRKSSICDSSDSTPEKIRSSKKRKVGRPKKVLTSSGLCVATETIVAKKPRSKNGLVGYLLAAKKHLQMQNKSELTYAASSPPKYSEETPNSTPTKSNKLKSHHQTGRISNNGSENEQKASKIRPKLKAETQLKQYTEDEDTAASEWEIASQTEDNEDDVVVVIVPEPEPEPEEPVPTAKTQADVRCILMANHLDVDKLRVLTAMGGLFYAGQLTAIQAPDVYAITLDGERGNRPHIMSREEILRDAIVEVSPTSTSELLPGTRLCAYWSQQYRCLYPGTVAEPGTPDPILDLKFVSVEFDDGDSGRIALDDIRLLPTDYPIIEYDPNPLLSLSKRRRRTSVNNVTEERRLTNQTNNPTLVTVPTPQIPIESAKSAEKENTALNRQDSHRERKRLKKRRKEKLKRMMCHDDKKKKRKHRCCDEHCKHRKHHKKHRKHKKHHHARVEAEEQQVTEPVVVAVTPAAAVEEVVKKEVIEEEVVVKQEKIETTKVENKAKKTKKRKERRESNESRSKMAAFLPARQIWGWSGRGYKRVGVKGRARKQFFKSIQRGRESITVGDCAVFLSTGRPDRPYIGKIEAMWESWGTNMVVRVKWFYHPEETVGCPPNLKYPGALFESPHVDENDVQTISHKCEVLPLKDYTTKLGPEPQRYETIYDNNDIYYLAGYYDPITPSLTMEPDIPVSESNE